MNPDSSDPKEQSRAEVQAAYNLQPTPEQEEADDRLLDSLMEAQAPKESAAS
jgi:hypothetical protein